MSDTAKITTRDDTLARHHEERVLQAMADRLALFSDSVGVGYDATTRTYGLWSEHAADKWLTIGYPTVHDAARERHRDTVRALDGRRLPIDARHRDEFGRARRSGEG